MFSHTHTHTHRENTSEKKQPYQIKEISSHSKTTTTKNTRHDSPSLGDITQGFPQIVKGVLGHWCSASYGLL